MNIIFIVYAVTIGYYSRSESPITAMKVPNKP